MGCHASTTLPGALVAALPSLSSSAKELAEQACAKSPRRPSLNLLSIPRPLLAASDPVANAKRLKGELAELQVQLDKSRANWQRDEDRLKKAIYDKAEALQLALGSPHRDWKGKKPQQLAEKAFEVEVPFEDRTRFAQVVKSQVLSTLPFREADLRRLLHVEDVQGGVLPQHVGFPEDSSMYPLRARYREPQVRISDPRKRGVKLGALLDFFQREVGEIIYASDDSRSVCIPTKLARSCNRFNMRHRAQAKYDLTPNLYAVEALHIRPMTERDRISMAELWHRDLQEGVQIEAFVSHCWVEDFGEFCQSTYRFALHRARKNFPGISRDEVDQKAKELALYVCAFSNNQWNLSAELGDHIEDSPFYKVLKAPTTATVIMNMDQMGALLFRAWCTFEFLFSLELKKDVVLNTRFGPLRDIKAENEYGEVIEVWIVHVFELLQDVDIRMAQATSQEDLDMIQASIRQFVGTGVAEGLSGADALNKHLKSMIADQVLPLLARVGNTAALETALDCGASPDAQDHRHVCALTYATAMHGADSPPAKALLDRGADPLAQNAAHLVVAMFGEDMIERKKAIKQVSALPEGERKIYAAAIKAAQEDQAIRWRAAMEQLTKNSWATVKDDEEAHKIPRDQPAATKGENHTPTSKLGSAETARVVQEPESKPSFDDDDAKPGAPPPHQAQMHNVAAHLEAEDEDARRAACEVLGDLGEAAGEHAEALAERLRDEDSAVRRAAAAALARMGEAAAPHAAAIAERLRDEDHDVREAACEALAQLGAVSADFLPQLAATLGDTDSGVRAAAATAIAHLGGGGRTTSHAPLLADRLGDSSPRVRKAALDALSSLGEPAAEYVEAVSRCLVDPDWRIREAACNTLAQLGEAAFPYLENVLVTLHDKDGDVRKGALDAFQKIVVQSEKQDNAAHTEVIMECLADANADVRQSACGMLAQMVGEAAPPLVGAVAERLGDQDASVRLAAVKGLGSMGEAAAPFSELIAERLMDDDQTVQEAAREALVQLATHDVPALKQGGSGSSGILKLSL